MKCRAGRRKREERKGKERERESSSQSVAISKNQKGKETRQVKVSLGETNCMAAITVLQHQPNTFFSLSLPLLTACPYLYLRIQKRCAFQFSSPLLARSLSLSASHAPITRLITTCSKRRRGEASSHIRLPTGMAGPNPALSFFLLRKRPPSSTSLCDLVPHAPCSARSGHHF